MAEYTYKNVIVDPTSEGAKNCIGRVAYFADNPTVCLEAANNNDDCFRGVLDRLKDGYFPFVSKDSYRTSWACIILCKEESSPS